MEMIRGMRRWHGLVEPLPSLSSIVALWISFWSVEEVNNAYVIITVWNSDVGCSGKK